MKGANHFKDIFVWFKTTAGQEVLSKGYWKTKRKLDIFFSQWHSEKINPIADFLSPISPYPILFFFSFITPTTTLWSKVIMTKLHNINKSQPFYAI